MKITFRFLKSKLWFCFLLKVNRSTSLEFRFTTENFPICEILTIPDIDKGMESCIRHIELKDLKNRILGLNAKIELRHGRSIRVSIKTSSQFLQNENIYLLYHLHPCSTMVGIFQKVTDGNGQCCIHNV